MCPPKVRGWRPFQSTTSERAPGTFWTTLLTITLFSLSISMLLFFWVIDKIDVTQASLSIYLLPVFGVLLSTVFVGEKVTTQLVFGGLLVFTGTFLVTVYEGRKRLRAAPGAVER